MNGITLMQYIFLIHGSQLGTGILSLPRTLAVKSGTDGWMSIVLAWLINCLAGWIMLLVLKKYPDHTLPDLFNHLFGKWLGRLLVIPFVAYFAITALITMVNAMLFIKAWFLPKTPGYLIIFLFSIPSFLVVRHGLRVLARYSELVFFMLLWMPFIFLLRIGDTNWMHLLPLFKEGWEPVVRGLSETAYAFAGNEILFFIYPFLIKKQYAVHGMIIANTITMLIYTFVTIMCFVFFSPDGITTLNQPALNFLQIIEFRFLERFDMIFLAVYLFEVSTAWNAYAFCTAFSTSNILNKQDHSSHALMYFLLVIGCVYIAKPTWNLSEKWTTFVSDVEVVVMYVFPLFLLIFATGLEKYRTWKSG